MEKYRLELKRSAVKEIESLPRKEIITILDKIRELANDPKPADARKLSGQEKYRVRCGNYRILYLIEDDVLVVYIVKVGHRKDVYR